MTPSPAFLDYPRKLQQNKGHKNAHPLLGVEQIPCDHQVRNLLDPLAPSALDRVFVTIFKGLDHHGMCARLRGLGDQLLVALDGTQYFASKAIHCPPCLSRSTPNSPTLSYHTAITPVVVCPGHSPVIALPREYILPQDGRDKQDCERVAGKRWISKHAKELAPHGVTLLGDDLYSNQPFGTLGLQHGYNFIVVCKPDSHAKLYER